MFLGRERHAVFEIVSSSGASFLWILDIRCSMVPGNVKMLGDEGIEIDLVVYIY